MVIPCYNKERFIAATFDTVLAQTWENVELVLVNDGSTDATRDIIAQYIPRFADRGYEVALIDQENIGVCGAAKAGLERASGDFVCMIDADDELDPAYLSTMAQWLDDHVDCQLAICSGVNFKQGATGREYWHYPSTDLPADDNDIAPEHFLIGKSIRNTVWIYMARASYLRACGLPQSYVTDTRGSHEPGYVIPLLAQGGAKKYFPVALYHFNGSGEGHSQFKDMAHAQRFYDEYHRLCVCAVDALPDCVAGFARKAFLRRVSLLSRATHLYRVAVLLKAPALQLRAYSEKMLDAVNEVYGVLPAISTERFWGHERQLMSAAEARVFGGGGEGAFPELCYTALSRLGG
jgi:glycosyltransferase involved in cell wall biosynthesis